MSPTTYAKHGGGRASVYPARGHKAAGSGRPRRGGAHTTFLLWLRSLWALQSSQYSPSAKCGLSGRNENSGKALGFWHFFVSWNPRGLRPESSSSMASTSLTHSGDDENSEDPGVIPLFFCWNIRNLPTEPSSKTFASCTKTRALVRRVAGFSARLSGLFWPCLCLGRTEQVRELGRRVGFQVPNKSPLPANSRPLIRRVVVRNPRANHHHGHSLPMVGHGCGADGRLPIWPQCGRVYDQFHSFIHEHSQRRTQTPQKAKIKNKLATKTLTCDTDRTKTRTPKWRPAFSCSPRALPGRNKKIGRD